MYHVIHLKELAVIHLKELALGRGVRRDAVVCKFHNIPQM